MSLEKLLTRDKGKHCVHHIDGLFSQRQSGWLHILVVAVVLGLAHCETDTECSLPGWFGPECKYQCHCEGESQCQASGECTGRCAVFWFGPKCQYRYAELRQEGSQDELTELTDSSSSSCLKNRTSESLHIGLTYPQRLQMIRFELTPGGRMDQLSFIFWKKLESGDTKRVCEDVITKEETNDTYDVMCIEPDHLHSIWISGEISILCSLYVSVGRNVAIKEHASQSNTLKKWIPRNSVDGVIPRWSKDITEEDLKKTCARTSSPGSLSSESWKITLPKDMLLQRITIHGGMQLPAEDCCKSDLGPIEVLGYSTADKLIFVVPSNESYENMERTILPEMNAPVNSIVIRSMNKSLTLCEVQIFEETNCPWGHFGMNCELQCNCDRKNESCNPVTGKCPGGCDMGFRGARCDIPCAKGRYGFDCSKRCSANCKTGSNGCRKDSGQCISGCKKDYAPPFCDYRICRQTYFFGKGCKFACMCLPGQKECDRVTGSCLKLKINKGITNGNCRKRYFGHHCQERYMIAKSASHKALTDANDKTCITDTPTEAYVNFKAPQRTHFVRIIVSTDIKPVYSWKITLEGQGEIIDCHTRWNAQVEKNAADFLCGSTKLISKIRITGQSLKGLCSVFVSGGRNQALKRSATLTSRYNRERATRAVDGKPSNSEYDDVRTCAHTLYRRGREERFMLSLPETRNITEVLIQNRFDPDARHRLKNFGLRFLDSNRKLLVEYRDRQRTQHWFTVYGFGYTSKVVKNFEVFSNKRYLLTFCDLYIFGSRDCPQGTYGINCERVCNCKRAKEYCFPETGACPSGCREGYRGFDCWATCPRGTYGSGCNSACSDKCEGGPEECSGIDGTCTLGCTFGFRLPTCKKVCNKGTYGKSCAYFCSRGCKGPESLCDRKTGNCEMTKCKPGYLGLRCDKICPAPNFGLDCLQNCTSACASAACHHEDGRCDDCPRGFTGDFCEERCPSHYHGPRCRHNCSSDCFQARCDPVQGRCKSCEIGLEGPYCNQMCQPGFHGWGCKERCSPHCRGGVTTCFPNNGSCWHGCENDMPPPQCKEPESIFGAAAAPISMIFFAALVSLGIFAVFWERRPSPMTRRGESGGTGSEVVAASHHPVIPAISKEQSTALSKEKISKEKSSSKSRSDIRSVSSKQERSKSKELTSGT